MNARAVAKITNLLPRHSKCERAYAAGNEDRSPPIADIVATKMVFNIHLHIGYSFHIAVKFPKIGSEGISTFPVASTRVDTLVIKMEKIGNKKRVKIKISVKCRLKKSKVFFILAYFFGSYTQYLFENKTTPIINASINVIIQPKVDAYPI